jgi:hypothetical protein
VGQQFTTLHQNDVCRQLQTLALPLSSEIVRVFSLGDDNYELSIPRPPSSAIYYARLRERERFVNDIRETPEMSAPREALYYLWLGIYRVAVNADEGSRRALLAQAATLEGGLRLWWDEVFSPSGLVRVLRRQAYLLGLCILSARYGDYAAEGLEIVKQMAGEKGFLKPLFEGPSWTDGDREIGKEVRRLPVNRVGSECGCVSLLQRIYQSVN